VAATLVERMGTVAAERELGRPCRALDLHLHYLGQSTTGPFRVTGTVLRTEDDTVTTEVAIVDASDGRLLDLGTATCRALG
jgi:acyl-coenzyme A thioesterase PaaI-like protein